MKRLCEPVQLNRKRTQFPAFDKYVLCIDAREHMKFQNNNKNWNIMRISKNCVFIVQVLHIDTLFSFQYRDAEKKEKYVY